MGLISQGLPVRIVSLHPVESGFSSAAGGTGATTDVRKWIVKAAGHTFGQSPLTALTS